MKNEKLKERDIKINSKVKLFKVNKN